MLSEHIEHGCMYCLNWTTYLNFCALVFSSMKWAELYQSLSSDKMESSLLRVLHGSFT